MSQETILRKSIPLEDLIPLLPQAEDVNFWRNLKPDSTVSDNPFSDFQIFPEIDNKTLDEYALHLR